MKAGGTSVPSARASLSASAKEGGGGAEEGKDGLSEGIQNTIAFGAMRSAPVQTISAAALANAARQAARVPTVGPSSGPRSPPSRTSPTTRATRNPSH